MAVGTSAISAACIAAAAEVWPYPYPRACLIGGAMFMLFAAFSSGLVWQVAQTMRHRGITSKLRGLALFFAVCAGFALALAAAPLGEVAACSHPQNELCSLSADKATPAQIEQMAAALAPIRFSAFGFDLHW